MTAEEVKAKMAELLLPELKAGKLEWYYISMADEDRFHHGLLVRAHGPTDALRLMHSLNLWDKGCGTMTRGPIREDVMKRIPESMRWRKLSLEDVEGMDRLAGGDGKVIRYGK